MKFDVFESLLSGD